jgi:hypothetical protein
MNNWYWCSIKNSIIFLTNCQICFINTFRLIENFRLSYDWWSRKLRFKLTTVLSDKINIQILFVQYKDFVLLCFLCASSCMEKVAPA